MRRGRVLFDKAGTPGSFGPTARRGRRRSITASSRIPADVDWSAFQAAPPDQRTEFLHGDEGILLEGLHPVLARVMAQLPHVRAEGGVYGPLTPGGPVEQKLELDADLLHIDARRLVCTVTWRAAMPVASERELAGLSLAMGVTVGGEPVTSLDAEDAAPTRENPRRAARALARGHDGSLGGRGATGHARGERAPVRPRQEPGRGAPAEPARAAPAIRRRRARSRARSISPSACARARRAGVARACGRDTRRRRCSSPSLFDRPVEETVRFTTESPSPCARPSRSPRPPPRARRRRTWTRRRGRPRRSRRRRGRRARSRARSIRRPGRCLRRPRSSRLRRAPAPELPVERAPEPPPPPRRRPHPRRRPSRRRRGGRVGVGAAEPAAPPPPPPRPRPPPGPDMNAGLYNRFTKKK